MENPQTLYSNFTASPIVTEMDQFIPKELQLPAGIAVGIFAIALIVGLVKMSSGKKEPTKVQFDSSVESTPVKSSKVSESGTPINQKTGTVFTPAGRRSARLARRKED